jgi:hypothetical protein
MEKGDDKEHELYPLKSILNIEKSYNEGNYMHDIYHLQFRSWTGSETCTECHPIQSRTWKSIKMDLEQGLGNSPRSRGYY